MGPDMSQPPASPASPRPAADSTLQQRAWAAVLMTLIGLFGLTGTGDNIQRGVYVIIAVVVIMAVALWLAATSMTRARRIGSSRPRGAIFATVLGIIGVLLGGMILATCAVFWPQMTGFSQCVMGANTITAQNSCSQQLMNSVGSREIKFMPGTKA